MSKTIFVKGDLLDFAEKGAFDIIVHGCNCFNVMGGGIAYAIAKKYPQAKLVDSNTIWGDKEKIGTFTISKAISQDLISFFIINAYTQFSPSRKEDVFEYEAFDRILNQLAESYPFARFGFPLIGCGLAGGNKERILKQIEEFANKIQGTVTVVEWDKN